LLQYFKGLKSTLIAIVIVSVFFTLTLYFQSKITPWLSVIGNVLYPLLLVTLIFSAQFSRSRFSILSIIWLLFYLSFKEPLLWSQWLGQHMTWLFLTGGAIFFLLSFVKDRGLLSIHSFYRFILLVVCGLLVLSWQYLTDELIVYLANTVNSKNYFFELINRYSQYLLVEIPTVFFALILLWRSLIKISLFDSALFISFVVWCLDYYQWLSLPWSLTITLLACYYILVVIIDAYFLAYRDELTGLPSRRALNQLALSLGSKYTVAMLDIDHFKKFNDTYGHDIGDQVLKLVAAKLANVKGGGKVFRYGGEEFTIVFPRKDGAHSQIELEKVRQAVADYKIVIRHPQRKSKQDRKSKKGNDFKTVSVTISIGYAVRQSKQKFTQVLKLSDLALYRAKNNGRNNVSD